MKMYDIFSGPGFMSLGMEREGFIPVVAVEFERYAASTYAMNRPDVPVLFCDIAKVDFSEVAKLVGNPDVIVGGPPCQGFSTAKPEKYHDSGAQKTKRGMFQQAIRSLREAKPKGFLFENVTGLKKRGLQGDLIRALEAVGYTVTFEQSRASDFGVPQNRDRVFFAGSRGKRVEIPTATVKTLKTLRQAIGSLPTPPVGVNENDPLHFSAKHSEEIKSRIGSTKPGMSYAPNWKSSYRLPWEKPSLTVTCNCRLAHPSQSRIITTREMARIQSIPDSYRFSPGRLIEQIGNGVPPPLAAAWARSLKAAISTGKMRESVSHDDWKWDEAIRIAESLDRKIEELEEEAAGSPDAILEQGTVVQTLIFDKDEFTEKQARKWAKDRDFRFGKVDETENTFRLRQRDPEEFTRIVGTKELTKGVQAVFGFLK